MSIADFERRKALQQAEARAIEQAAALLKRLHRYSAHCNSCHCREDDDPSCTCGYTQLLKAINEFTQ